MSGAEQDNLVLDLTEVGKSYGKHRALDGVSFSLKRGSFAGLLGPNGAGKSTLFQLIAGLFVPDEGEVQVLGRSHLREGTYIRARLGVVFQARSVDLDITVDANLKFHGELFGLTGSKLNDRIEELCAFLQLIDMRKRLVRTLSGGEQRRVEVARALINRPELLLMDEPSAGLDTQSRRLLVEHMRQLATDTGTTILWATHLVEELDLADQIVVLAKGKVVIDGPITELLAKTGADNLTDAYVALTGVPRAEAVADPD